MMKKMWDCERCGEPTTCEVMVAWATLETPAEYESVCEDCLDHAEAAAEQSERKMERDWRSEDQRIDDQTDEMGDY